MRISVVICTRNRADELANCLGSLEYQTAPEFEVLVVQGPCADHTDAVIERYAGRLRHLRCANANLSEARNIGIAAAASEVVAFIDDDAVGHPKWLEQLISGYTADDIGGVGGLVFDNTGRTLQYKYSACWRSGETLFDVTPPFDKLNGPNADPFLYLQGTNCSFRRSCLAEVGGFNEQFAYLHDETDLCLRILDKGYRLAPLDSAAVYHKIAKSDLRTARRIVVDPYFLVRSNCIFALQHGKAVHAESDLQRRIGSYMGQVIVGGIEARSRGDLSEEQFSHYLARACEGRSSGVAAAQSPILRTFEQPNHANFRRFPVKRAPSTRLTVCFLSREYPPDGYGGIGRFTHDLAAGFAADGHHVHVVTDGTRGDTTDFESGVWIHRLAHAPRVPPEHVPLTDHFDLAGRNQREVDRIFSEMPIDIVSAPLWNCESLITALDPRFPTVLTLMTSFKVIQSLHPSTLDAVQTGPILKLEQACYRAHKYVHAISRDVLDRAESDFGKAGAAKVVHLGVQDQTRGRRARLFGSRVRVLFVGRLERRKGVDLLLDAAAKLIGERLDIEFDLVGSSSIHTELADQSYEQWFRRTFAGQADILSRVSFAGQVNEDELHGHYAEATIFCLPSRYESLGLVLMEAMSYGLPVIAADVGGMREVVTHRSDGLLFEPGNATSLADAIRLLTNRPQMRDAMSEAARKSFESRFATTVTVPQALSFYTSIARSFTAAGAQRGGNTVLVSRLARFIEDCSGIHKEIARRTAADLLAATSTTTALINRKRSNAERFRRFLSEIPGAFGRNKRRIKRILNMLERQDASVAVAVKSLAAVQSGIDTTLETLRRDNSVLRKQVEEIRQMLADRNSAREGDARQDDEIHRLRAKILGLENPLRALTATHKIILTPTEGVLPSVTELLALLGPHDVTDHRKVRLGRDSDGGYVMLDDFEAVGTALSFGIGADASWDVALADRGIRVLQFDDTIEVSPSAHRRLSFFRKRIVPSAPDGAGSTTLAQALDEHVPPDDDRLILKIDIEGGEWDVLDALAGSVIDRFHQIVCEFHDFHRILEADWRDRAHRVLTKLNDRHAVVHIHGNNFRPMISIGDMLVPDVIELTYVRSRGYALTDTTADFPGPLDNPNDPGRLDYYLGSFDFGEPRS